MNVKKRIEIEREIVKSLLSELISHGFVMRIYDGEEMVTPKSANIDVLFDACFSVDEESIYVYQSLNDDCKRFGWIFLVYGNDGWDVICDYTTNLENYIKETNALADKLGNEYS